MSELIPTRLAGDVAVLRIDSPPVSALDAAVHAAPADAVRQAEPDALTGFGTAMGMFAVGGMSGREARRLRGLGAGA